LTSEEGIRMRKKRPIEPEAVFGQMKFDKSYYRFRHKGKDKVAMDFAIFAIAFNMGKMYKTKQNQAFLFQNTPQNSQDLVISLFVEPIWLKIQPTQKNRDYITKLAA
ncbi:transposase, partial [Gaoshiqia sediminis]|uniref:transposase n=1 Tax=Gaoshiqia sediminis TaxID=2986998 RepID=UPI003D0F721E